MNFILNLNAFSWKAMQPDVRQREILQMKDSFRHRDANESLLGARPSFADARV
jgi:hypothetical protein